MYQTSHVRFRILLSTRSYYPTAVTRNNVIAATHALRRRLTYFFEVLFARRVESYAFPIVGKPFDKIRNYLTFVFCVCHSGMVRVFRWVGSFYRPTRAFTADRFPRANARHGFPTDRWENGENKNCIFFLFSISEKRFKRIRATAKSKRSTSVLRRFIGTVDQNLKGAIDDGFLIYFSYLSRLQLGSFECSSKAADRVLCN